MASFFVSTDTGKAAEGAGKRQANYIAGAEKFEDKKEVVAVIDKNLPKWAKDGADFFDKADKLERANGRSYRSLVIAIPREAKDPTAWAQAFTDDLLKDKHAYRLGIHDKKDGNPHAHLMFCERGRKSEDKKDDPKAYFVRANPKIIPSSKAESKIWLEDTKKLFLKHVQKVAPTFTWSKEKATGKIKELKKFKNESPKYTEKRLERKDLNQNIEYTKHNLEILDKQEAALNAKTPTPTPTPQKSVFNALGAVQSAPAPTPAPTPQKVAAISSPHEVRNSPINPEIEKIKAANPISPKSGGGGNAAMDGIRQAIREMEKNNQKNAIEQAARANTTQKEMKQTAQSADAWTQQVTAQAKAEERKAQQATIKEQHGPSLARAFVGRDAGPVVAVLSDESKRAQFAAEMKAWQSAYNSKISSSAQAPGLNEQLKARADAALTIAEQLAIERKTGPSPSQAAAPRPAFRPF